MLKHNIKTLIKKNWFLVLLFLSLFFYLLTGLKDLYIDTLNPDGLNWHERSFNFTEALINREFSKTFQAYHPGVTLMWITGPVLHLVANNYVSQGFQVYSKDTYLNYDYWAKFSLVVSTGVLFIYSLYLLKKVLTKKSLIIFTILLLFEPFVLGVRRLHHLDYLATYTLFISFLNLYIYFYKDSKIIYKIIGSLFFVLSLLTKSSSLIFVPVVFLMLIFSKHSIKNKLASALIILASSILFLYILFPALWGNPFKTFPSIYKKVIVGIVDIGIENKKEADSKTETGVVVSKSSKGDTDWYFYLQEIPYVMSPVALTLLIISLGFFVYRLTKNSVSALEVYSFLTFFILVLVMSVATKKGLRYGVVFMPFLFLLISSWMENISFKVYLFLIGFYLITLLPQYYNIHPYYYVYGNPLLGGVKSRTEIFDPSPFGVASHNVGKIIYPEIKDKKDVRIAASKIFKYIFPYAKVVNWPNCSSDFAVVFSTDDAPEKVCGGSYVLFNKVTIAGYDYWKIYKHL